MELRLTDQQRKWPMLKFLNIIMVSRQGLESVPKDYDSRNQQESDKKKGPQIKSVGLFNMAPRDRLELPT
jgi:hypothetical protein